MATTKAQQKAVNKYIKNNYDRLNITLPAGQKAVVDSFAAEMGISTNKLINELLRVKTGQTEEEWKKPEQ